MSKLSDFLAREKIDPRRLSATSHALESLTFEDRAIKTARVKAKAGGEKSELAAKKPRSGRPVTPRQLTDALAGSTVTGPTKHKVLRAVNKLLANKKKSEVGLKDLF